MPLASLAKRRASSSFCAPAARAVIVFRRFFSIFRVLRSFSSGVRSSSASRSAAALVKACKASSGTWNVLPLVAGPDRRQTFASSLIWFSRCFSTSRARVRPSFQVMKRSKAGFPAKSWPSPAHWTRNFWIAVPSTVARGACHATTSLRGSKDARMTMGCSRASGTPTLVTCWALGSLQDPWPMRFTAQIRNW